MKGAQRVGTSWEMSKRTKLTNDMRITLFDCMIGRGRTGEKAALVQGDLAYV